jgi:colanic acid/amylovoran biosynthesis glycosyltransferase
MNVALISPNQKAYSETFIQQHKKHIKGNIYFYYDGYLPKRLEGELLINPRKLRVKHILKGHYRLNKFSLSELLILNSFKDKKIDIVFAEYGNTAVHVLPICKELDLPLIVHFHGHDASVITELEQAKYYKEVFEYACSIIVVSKKMLADFKEWRCPAEKLVYNPYGPRPEFYNVRPTFNNQQFVAIGRFTEKKAPYYLLLSFKKVLEKFPDSRLIIGGDGELLQICKNLSCYYKLDNRVDFPGILNSKEFIHILKNSMALVQHSVVAGNGDSEGTPVAILEAAAAGLPVLSTLHAGIPDVIKNGEHGFLVDEHDVNGMARKMIQILEDPQKARQMGRAGSNRVKKEFNLSRHIQVINDLIKEHTAQ